MAAIDTGKGRFYPWKEQKFVSVTTAISEGLPKPALNKWFIRSMAELAASKRHELVLMEELAASQWLLDFRSPNDGVAAKFGTNIHAMIERIAKGKTVREPSEDEKPYMDAFHKFVKKYNPVFLENEATVYSTTHGYAGTMDAMLEIDGNVYVVDTKTGKSVWPEAALQLAAYRHADFIGRIGGREDAIPPCSGGFILHIRPRGFKVIPVDTGPQVFDTFLSALDMFRWINFDSDYVIGKAWK